MDRVIVNIEVPALGKSFDFSILKGQRLSESIELIKKTLYEISDGVFIPSDDTVLCYSDDGKIISINHTVEDVNLKNGVRLLLI